MTRPIAAALAVAAVLPLALPAQAQSVSRETTRETTTTTRDGNTTTTTTRTTTVGAGASVDADALLGAADGTLLDRVLDLGKGAVAAEMAGASGAAFDLTMAYLRERKQFGKAIGEFQSLQHRAAHLYSELEITQAIVLKALQAIDAGSPDASMLASVAKARAGKSGELAVQEAVQMHGGVGMTDEYDVGLYMKRMRVAQELFGDWSHHAEAVARAGGY